MNKKQGIFIALMLLFQGLPANIEKKVAILEKGFKILAAKITILEQKLPVKTTIKDKKKRTLDKENKKSR